MTNCNLCIYFREKASSSSGYRQKLPKKKEEKKDVVEVQENKVVPKRSCFSNLMVCINHGASERGEPAQNFVYGEQIILKPRLEIPLHIH